MNRILKKGSTQITTITILILLTLSSGCMKQKKHSAANKTKNYTLFSIDGTETKPRKKRSSTPLIKLSSKKNAQKKPTEIKLNDEIDFEVENRTGRTVFIACFSYIQKVKFTQWHWDKSPVYKLDPNEKVIINVDTIPDPEDREHVFGYLSIFENETQAHDAIFELVPDAKKIDLDRIHLLKKENKKVIITIEQYGIKKGILDFTIAERFKKKEDFPELDFTVENGTGKTIFVTGFVYQVEDNLRSVWSFDKTPVLRLNPGQSSTIDVDTVTEGRDRGYMHGYLAIFEEYEEHKAHTATYELLDPKNRITLGRLAKLHNKKIVVEIEKYGTVGSITEFSIKPTKLPWKKDAKIKPQPTIVTPKNSHNKLKTVTKNKPEEKLEHTLKTPKITLEQNNTIPTATTDDPLKTAKKITTPENKTKKQNKKKKYRLFS